MYEPTSEPELQNSAMVDESGAIEFIQRELKSQSKQFGRPKFNAWAFMAKWEGERDVYYAKAQERFTQIANFLGEGTDVDEFLGGMEIGTEPEIWNSLNDLMNGTLQNSAKGARESLDGNHQEDKFSTAEDRLRKLLNFDYFLLFPQETRIPHGDGKLSHKAITWHEVQMGIPEFDATLAGYTSAVERGTVEAAVTETIRKLSKAYENLDRRPYEVRLQEYKDQLEEIGIEYDPNIHIVTDGEDKLFASVEKELERHILRQVNTELSKIGKERIKETEAAKVQAIVRAEMEDMGITLQALLGPVKRGLTAKKYDAYGREIDDHSSQLKAATLGMIAGGFMGIKAEETPQANITVNIDKAVIASGNEQEVLAHAIRRARAVEGGTNLDDIPEITVEQMQKEADATGFAPTHFHEGETGRGVILEPTNRHSLLALSEPQLEEKQNSATQPEEDPLVSGLSSFVKSKPEDMPFGVMKRDSVESAKSRRVGNLGAKVERKTAEVFEPEIM